MTTLNAQREDLYLAAAGWPGLHRLGGRANPPPFRAMMGLAWNPTDGLVQLRIEMRPALRWVEFVRRFFAGEDPIALLADFSDEIVLP